MTSRTAGRRYPFLVAMLGLLAALMLLPTSAVSETPSPPPSTVTPMPSATPDPDEPGDLIERCIDQELIRPTVEAAYIAGPGQRTQSEIVGLEVAATPEECRGVVERMVQYEVVKDELHRIDGGLRHEVVRMQWFGYDGYTREVAGPMGISGAANPHRGEKAYYHCSVGRARTKVRLNMRVIITNVSTDKEIARKKFPGPLLEIRGINKGKGC